MKIIYAKVDVAQLRELARLGLAAHGGFHGGRGEPIEKFAEAGCKSCKAIHEADEKVRAAEGRTEKLRLLDLDLEGTGPRKPTP